MRDVEGEEDDFESILDHPGLATDQKIDDEAEEEDYNMLNEVQNLAEYAEAKIIIEQHEKAVVDLNQTMPLQKEHEDENPFACYVSVGQESDNGGDADISCTQNITAGFGATANDTTIVMDAQPTEIVEPVEQVEDQKPVQCHYFQQYASLCQDDALIEKSLTPQRDSTPNRLEVLEQLAEEEVAEVAEVPEISAPEEVNESVMVE